MGQPSIDSGLRFPRVVCRKNYVWIWKIIYGPHGNELEAPISVVGAKPPLAAMNQQRQ